jgi:hypothetical protein
VRELGVTETVAQQAHRDCRTCRRAISPLKELDYIDVGAMLPNSGTVAVVIKLLIFPMSAAPGKEWQGAPRVVAG